MKKKNRDLQETDASPSEEENFEDEEAKSELLENLIDFIKQKETQENIKIFFNNKRETEKENNLYKMKLLEYQHDNAKKDMLYFWSVAIFVILAICVLGYVGKIEIQTIGVLFGAIVGYLFGRLRRGEN